MKRRPDWLLARAKLSSAPKKCAAHEDVPFLSFILFACHVHRSSCIVPRCPGGQASRSCLEFYGTKLQESDILAQETRCSNQTKAISLGDCIKTSCTVPQSSFIDSFDSAVFSISQSFIHSFFQTTLFKQTTFFPTGSTIDLTFLEL
jgi:hypothetical protein